MQLCNYVVGMCLRRPLYGRFKYVAHREEYAARMLASPFYMDPPASPLMIFVVYEQRGWCAVDGAVAVPSGLWITPMLHLRYRSYLESIATIATRCFAQPYCRKGFQVLWCRSITLLV